MNATVFSNNRHCRAHGRVQTQPATATGHRYLTLLGSAWSATARALSAFAEGIVDARRISRLYDELAAMSDPELQDIGINRADIPTVIFGTHRALSTVVPVLVSSNRRDRSPSPNRCE